MSFMDKAKDAISGNADKAKEFAEGNADKVEQYSDQGLDKAGEFAESKGVDAAKVDQGRDFVDDKVGNAGHDHGEQGGSSDKL